MGFGIDGIGADLMAAFSHRRAEITKVTDQELVPRFQARHGRAPNQRELAALQEQATLRTRVNKEGAEVHPRDSSAIRGSYLGKQL
jgi:hypothetical protein